MMGLLLVVVGLGAVVGQQCVPPITDTLYIVDSTPSMTRVQHQSILTFLQRTPITRLCAQWQ